MVATMLTSNRVVSIMSEAAKRYQRRAASDLHDLDGVDMAKPYIPYDGPVVTRDEARANGLKRFFLGLYMPCSDGHVSERQTSNSMCMECHRLRAQTWRVENPERVKQIRSKSRAKNPESAKEYAAKWYGENLAHVKEYSARYRAENPGIVKERTAKWRDENRDRVNEYSVQYRAENPERVKECYSKWYTENKDKVASYRLNRRARILAAEGSHTEADIVAIRTSQRGKCAMCGAKLKGGGHIDHIMPLSKGGSNWPRNLQILCVKCNLKKHAKHPIDFAQQMGLLL